MMLIINPDIATVTGQWLKVSWTVIRLCHPACDHLQVLNVAKYPKQLLRNTDFLFFMAISLVAGQKYPFTDGNIGKLLLHASYRKNFYLIFFWIQGFIPKNIEMHV